MKRVIALCLSFLTIIECQNATLEWLIKHNFIQFNNTAMLVDKDNQIIDGIKEFQRVAGFPVTGYLDEIQINATRGPVCLTSTVSHSNEYVPVAFWPKTQLTWTYHQPRDSFGIPSSNVIEQMIQRSFDIWTADIPLKAYKNQGYERADVNIHFYYLDHSAQSPICRQNSFDGPGGVLGHGFYPEVGELHLDLSEHWGIFQETHTSNQYTDLFSVIYHEIGHILGLQHSPYTLSTAMRFKYMEPRQYWRNYQINPHDALAIKRLYPGTNQIPSIWPWDQSTRAVMRNEPERPYEKNNIEPSVRFFDYTVSVNHELILVKNQTLWRLDYDGVIRGFPKTINAFLYGYIQPRIVDSLYQRHIDRYIVIFSNNLYYQYYDNVLVYGFPRRIVDLLGVEDRINDIKPMRNAEHLVFFLGESHIFLFDEYENRVVYVKNYGNDNLSMV